MLNRFLDFFRDSDDSDPSYIQLVRNILVFAIVATVASIIVVSTTSNTPGLAVTLTALGVSVAIEIIALIFATRGNILLAKLIVPIALIENGEPSRFTSLISYEGSSLDPLEIFIKSHNRCFRCC